jgi:hypothetical protein
MKKLRTVEVMTIIFNNKASFRDFAKDELRDDARFDVVMRFFDGSGAIVFHADFANGVERRNVLINFPLKAALKILRKRFRFRYDASQQRKAS